MCLCTTEEIGLQTRASHSEGITRGTDLGENQTGIGVSKLTTKKKSIKQNWNEVTSYHNAVDDDAKEY